MPHSSNPITPQMNPEQLRRFLAQPHLMDLATITPEGYPHVTPIWFDYDGEVFLVSTTRERKKARNIGKRPQAGFSIAEHNLPYAAVVGYGDVGVGDDPGGSLLKQLAHKYLPAEKADTYFHELMAAGGSRIVLTIRPRRMLSWTGE